MAGLLAFLVYQSAALPNAGPQLSASVSRIEHARDQFVVHVRVENSGGETAEGVSVSGVLQAGGRVLERVSTTISYVPAESSRRGALVFTRDPEKGELHVTPAGYELP